LNIEKPKTSATTARQKHPLNMKKTKHPISVCSTQDQVLLSLEFPPTLPGFYLLVIIWLLMLLSRWSKAGAGDTLI